ncbi:hypothetical protein PU634_10530 [Oceanimonas pelagia]|uniref:Uncharacterized protein n=1 Tax=Oceanimonas pelagia TaxID=3028314 RepID=A0AA50KM45_9GAMM|nr:hypothetical protein [Oceanimonas pelagia]WMC09552.1 hypothetical protein PU634_10530 [Oceanimonas pelagia]
MITRFPDWIQDPHRLPDRFWDPGMSDLARPAPDYNWYRVVEAAMLEQGIGRRRLNRWRDLRLLAFRPDKPFSWPGPINDQGEPYLQMPLYHGAWGSERRLRAEHAIWMWMYPELIDSRRMSCRWIGLRRPHQRFRGFNVNPWYHWPGNTKRIYLKMLLGDNLWFEWQMLSKQRDKPQLNNLTSEPEAALPQLDDDEFTFLD